MVSCWRAKGILRRKAMLFLKWNAFFSLVFVYLMIFTDSRSEFLHLFLNFILHHYPESKAMAISLHWVIIHVLKSITNVHFKYFRINHIHLPSIRLYCSKKFYLWILKVPKSLINVINIFFTFPLYEYLKVFVWPTLINNQQGQFMHAQHLRFNCCSSSRKCV